MINSTTRMKTIVPIPMYMRPPFLLGGLPRCVLEETPRDFMRKCGQRARTVTGCGRDSGFARGLVAGRATQTASAAALIAARSIFCMPVVVDLVLVGAVDEERHGLVELELGAAR